MAYNSLYPPLLVQVIARYRLKKASCKCNISLPQAPANCGPPAGTLGKQARSQRPDACFHVHVLTASPIHLISGALALLPADHAGEGP